VRDAQRQRLYDAEEQVCRQLDYAAAGARLVEVAGSTIAVPLERKLGSLEAAGAYAELIRRSPMFATIFPRAARVPVRVRLRAGGRAASYEAPDTIALHEPRTGPAWALRELVVLHELTHHGHYHDRLPEPLHGAAFAGAFRRLVGAVLGPEVALLLTAAYAEHRVAATEAVPA
jgi:putative metallohydrolase (TIGR04338 family)